MFNLESFPDKPKPSIAFLFLRSTFALDILEYGFPK